MKLKTLLWIGATLVTLPFASGCNACNHIGCWDHVEVDLVPEITATYDVSLVLDGEAGAFTCESNGGVDWVVRDVVGSAASVHSGCSGLGFWLGATPESVEITVAAQDGSWSGSANLSPTYQTHKPNGPDCPPSCRVARLTITDDLGAFEVQP